MSDRMRQGPSFWATVFLLLGAAQRRSHGRRRRTQELLNNRAGKNTTNWSLLTVLFGALLGLALNGVAAVVLDKSLAAGERLEAEHQGKFVVSGRFFQEVGATPWTWNGVTHSVPADLTDAEYEREAHRIARDYGGSEAAIHARLVAAAKRNGTEDFVSENEAAPGISGLGRSGSLTALVGSLVLLWWFVMMTFQGEGLELDLQRRRHPMWEWQLSHPVPPGVVFLAEMLTPIAGNPTYYGAPVFAGIVYGMVYGARYGFLALLLVGVPLTLTAACIGKALEIGVTLRVAPRQRGAIVGLMSWIGYASLMGFFLGMLIVSKTVTVLAGPLGVLARLPWPWLGLFLGRTPGGEFSFSLGVVTCLAGSAAGLIAAVWFSVWGTQQGLSGNFAADRGPARSSLGAVAWSREPLYRKEFLWFARDRSAIVQAVLVPITLAGTQAFNLRGLLVHATGAWNYLCGLAILFGTYFLWVLGPKSLASEGTALWIPLTWPRGLESLLKAKAWLWSLISSGVVSLVLGFAVWMYPREFWKIALVGVAWFVFGRSLAEKSVTLVRVPSESGEVPRVSSGRRWGAQLGMLTFATGVLTEQWTVALVGIVYSWMTAAAMWQNFRAHLPYLYDPWSEVLPQPPTLMHAMISISALVELSAVLTGIATAMAGREHFRPAQAVSYAACAVVVAFLVNRFLENRGVLPQEVWCWQPRREEETDAEPWWKLAGLGNARGLRSLALGVVGGVLLGGFAQGYMAVLRHLPEIGYHFRKAQEQMAAMPELRWSYAVMAVLFAPFAEEYLFRGLLFRALDREWGGWRAVVGSAAFFAAYHPPRSWLPVGLLGAANALLFKKTGRLAPAVLLHMAYNAVVLL